MKPFRIFLFGLIVFSLLAILSISFSDRNPVFLGFTFKIPAFSFSEPKKNIQYKDISHILRLSKQITDTARTISSDTITKEKGKETDKKSISFPKSSLSADSLRSVTRNLEFPNGNDTLLFPFFRELHDLSSNQNLIRILHYGDSQIEGDRITSYLRNQLQTQFGGSGIGLLPIVAANPGSMSYLYEISDNWSKISPFISSTGIQNFNKYGALLSFAKMNDNARLFGKEKDMEGWVNLKRSNLTYPLTQEFQLCRIFYGYNKSPMMVELKQNKILLDAELLPSSSGLKVLKWAVQRPVTDLTIAFKGVDSPYVFGIALDGSRGIAVDNIPLRGSSGLEFGKMDMNFLHSFYKLLNVKLLILQFGVNIVPNVTESYAFYQHNFLQQLTQLKKYNPEISIIVIGVSDVSRNGKDGFESYPNIEKIRDAQRNAAFEAGCGFWDIFEAMGGRNSMPSWVFADPPLAQKDFIHFNPIGAKLIGEMFYRSFMSEYNRFLESNKTK